MFLSKIKIVLFVMLFFSMTIVSKNYSKKELFKSEVKLAALLKQENYNNRAIKIYKNILKNNHSVSIYMDLGVLYKRVGDLKNAKEILKKAIDIKPKNQEVLKTLSDIYFEQEDYKNAEKYLKRLNLNKDTITKLALIYKEKNDTEKAIYYYDLLVNKYNQSFQRINLAILYEKQKKLIDAEKQLLFLYKESKDKYYATRYLIRFYKEHKETEKLENFINHLKLSKKKKKMRPLLKSKR